MTVRELDEAPNLLRLYARAALPRPRRRGAPRDGETAALPDLELGRHGVAVDREHLAAYDAVCGFRVSDTLPATYPHVLTFGLAMAVMTEPSFPLPLIGLVHIRNQITQARPIGAAERLDLRARAENLRPHDKGTRVDLVCEAASGDEVVWTDRSTYLRRAKVGARAAPKTAPADAGPSSEPNARWRVPADIGRRYAAVSGDSNPIHLRALTAKLFGFPTAIAHGMWVKARCLAALEGRLPDAFGVDVQFKLPVLLPATVAFRETIGPDGITFAVTDTHGRKPHLAGTVARTP